MFRAIPTQNCLDMHIMVQRYNFFFVLPNKIRKKLYFFYIFLFVRNKTCIPTHQKHKKKHSIPIERKRRIGYTWNHGYNSIPTSIICIWIAQNYSSIYRRCYCPHSAIGYARECCRVGSCGCHWSAIRAGWLKLCNRQSSHPPTASIRTIASRRSGV